MVPNPIYGIIWNCSNGIDGTDGIGGIYGTDGLHGMESMGLICLICAMCVICAIYSTRSICSMCSTCLMCPAGRTVEWLWYHNGNRICRCRMTILRFFFGCWCIWELWNYLSLLIRIGCDGTRDGGNPIFHFYGNFSPPRLVFWPYRWSVVYLELCTDHWDENMSYIYGDWWVGVPRSL